MQDEIVTRLARALEHQLPEAEAARAKRAPAANPDAEDLALQCWGIVLKNSYFGKEADAGYRLCEQALAIDPNNVRATVYLGVKYYLPILIGRSADAKGDLKKADDLISRALVLDPNFPNAHDEKAWIFVIEKRYDEAVAEEERAIALDPAFIDAVVGLAYNYQFLGQYEKSLEYFDRAIRLSPRDPILNSRYQGKAAAYLALKQYDQAIDWARRAIAVDPNNIATAHATLIAALVLTGREDEAHDALQRYLSPPRGPETIAAWKAYKAVFVNEHSAPRYVEFWDRAIEGLRKAGMAEG
jgi:adenylate cyclase